jgi:hypothetical protein
MVVKIKEGLIMETKGIKMAKVCKIPMTNTFNIVISYFDEKKNPDIYIRCENESEGNKLVDLILSHLN